MCDQPIKSKFEDISPNAILSVLAKYRLHPGLLAVGVRHDRADIEFIALEPIAATAARDLDK